MDQQLFGVEPDNDGLPSNLFNAEQVADTDPGVRFTREQLEVMRRSGLLTSNQTGAPDSVFFSHGALQDFLTKGAIAVLWDFVKQYAHLPQLQELVRCIRCNAKPNKDGISRPRRVYGLHSSKLVSAQKYRHPNCPAAGGKDVTYDAKHPDVMARLPAFLAAQLSITFTHSGAMDDDMLQHIHHDVMKGLSFQAACDRAVSFLRRNHNQAELEYLSLWNYQQQPGTQTLLDRPALSGAAPQFGTFGSAGHSKPYISSTQWAAGIWLEKYRPLAAFAFLYIASCLGDFLCGDHTFRIAKCRNRIGAKELVVQRLDDLMARKWVDGTGVSCITQLTLDAVESMKRIIMDDQLSGIQAA
ncbi:hypothetical protein WJX79_008950 [Trebouxia sp. C0005]